MDKIQKPKFLTENLEPCIEITETEIAQIKSILLEYISVEDLFAKVNPKLKISYVTRRESYSDTVFEKDNFIKIPREKMNLEERMLLAFFTLSNIKNDLNELLEYMNKMYEIIRYGNEDLIDRVEEDVAVMVIRSALTNHFAAKIKILIPDADEDDDKPYESTPKTEEELKKEYEELSNHPMFMTEMPENPEDNELLKAMQVLRFEGEADDVAKEFMENSKKSLDLYSKNKKFRYLKDAMLYICDAIEHLKEDQEVSQEMKYQIYFFRSGIHMMVKNYGYAIDDLEQCVKILDKDEAHLKIAECYLAMEETQKAKNLIEQRLKQSDKNLKQAENSASIAANEIQITSLNSNDINSINANKGENTDVFDVFGKFNEKLEKIKSSEREKQLKIQSLEVFKNMKNEEKAKIAKVLSEKGIKLKQQFHKIPPNYEASIYLDDENILHFPVLIVYEEFNTTDYLRDVEENSLISDILETLFSEDFPADKDKKYNLNTVKCYLEMSDMDQVLKKEVNSYFPLRNDERLIDVLRHSKVYMNGIPVIFIVSQITKFYTYFLQTKVILNRNTRNKYNNIAQ